MKKPQQKAQPCSKECSDRCANHPENRQEVIEKTTGAKSIDELIKTVTSIQNAKGEALKGCLKCINQARQETTT